MNTTKDGVVEVTLLGFYIHRIGSYFLFICPFLLNLWLYQISEGLVRTTIGAFIFANIIMILYGLYLIWRDEIQVERGNRVRRKPAYSWSPFSWEDIDRRSVGGNRSKHIRKYRIVSRREINRIDPSPRVRASGSSGSSSSAPEWYGRVEANEMTPREYEQYIARLWERKGYETKVTPDSNDRGIDIIATKPGQKVVIQAKKNSEGNPVSRPTVQKTYAAGVAEGADEVVVVTTASFTQPARNEAETLSDSCPVTLLDGV